jgi:hypothetical protein
MRMFDRPSCDSDFMSMTCAIPFSSFSSGIVMTRSSSSVACPGHKVTTWTVTSPTSGYASIGSRWKAAMPLTVNSAARVSVMNRCWSAKSTRRAITIDGSSDRAQRCPRWRRF